MFKFCRKERGEIAVNRIIQNLETTIRKINIIRSCFIMERRICIYHRKLKVFSYKVGKV